MEALVIAQSTAKHFPDDLDAQLLKLDAERARMISELHGVQQRFPTSDAVAQRLAALVAAWT